jgi:two-component system phosphate regulon sensor histidine kinase PhoR
VGLGLRARIALAAFAASAAALLAVLFWVGPVFRERAAERASRTLLAEARLVARVVERALTEEVRESELDALADEVGREVEARVTVVDLTGRVLADSTVSGPDLLALENYADRPEVAAALRTGAGAAARRSRTVGEDMLYAAWAVRHEGRLLGVARLALPWRAVAAEAGDLRRAVAFALFLALGVAALLSLFLAPPVVGSLREIVDAARRLAEGGPPGRIPAGRTDELGELARLLRRAASQMETDRARSARDRVRTEAILGAMGEGVLAVDQRGLVLEANEAFRAIFGGGDPRGRHYLESVRHREVDEAVRQVLSFGRREHREIDLPAFRSEGPEGLLAGGEGRRAFAITGVPLPGESGAPCGAVLTFHETTERRRVDQVRRDFVANASHELRTPLTSVRGFVEALEDGALADPAVAPRFLARIRAQADRMATLIEDLLELSRLESGGARPTFEEVLPAELAQEVVESFRDAALRKGMTLDLKEAGAPRVLTDPDRLRRILDNLVDNALKYTPSGGRVEVATAPEGGGGVLLSVTDDGPGIAPEHLPRIFERFYRVDKARSRDLGGTGLGLAIVRHLAEGMGATVTADSEVGRGTRFAVYLPPDPRPSGLPSPAMT